MASRIYFALLVYCLMLSNAGANEGIANNDYVEKVAPILQKYCAACHNSDEQEGKFSVADFEALMQGGEHGPALLSGDAESSRMIRMLTGKLEPKMPPEDQQAPNESEVEILVDWIKKGAIGPSGKSVVPAKLHVPALQSVPGKIPITSLTWNGDGSTLFTANGNKVRELDPKSLKPIRDVYEANGKINSLVLSVDGSVGLVATGVAGLSGSAELFEISSGKKLQTFSGHRDILYGAVLSVDGKLVATSGYDRRIKIFDVSTGEVKFDLAGHNGAVYDLAFHPTEPLLFSASADQTIKVWSTQSGTRLDTLGQPLKEQMVVALAPNRDLIFGGGGDNRVRVWKLASKHSVTTNPILHSIIAHDGTIVDLQVSPDEKWLASAGEDGVVKLWDVASMTEVVSISGIDNVTAMSFSRSGAQLAIATLDGTVRFQPTPTESKTSVVDTMSNGKLIETTGPVAESTEAEPNDSIAAASVIVLPANIQGVIEGGSQTADLDLYAFEVRKDEEWVFEVNASRSGSKLDSRIEIIDAKGESIVRVKLQAIRDSYFTFRGKDSNTSDDFRVHNWEEMELNELLYANGEVVKLWLYPRGPDSGFKVYPGEGNRYTYFDTSPGAHALQENCYIVKPYPADAEIADNGLPIFPIYFENDDDSKRKYGKDSRLTFRAPADGKYWVRVSDTRGFQGADFKYSLQIRPRRPDFNATLSLENTKLSPGSPREFSVRVDRLDDFDDEIQVDITGLPAGMHVTSPIIVEREQQVAFGNLWIDRNVTALNEADLNQIKVVATAKLEGRELRHELNGFGKLEVAPAAKLEARVVPVTESEVTSTNIVAADAEPFSGTWPDEPNVELTIAPGETITAKVVIKRNGENGPISFGNAESGRNLPHGIFVDNIGLNGLLVVEGKNERIFFITAAEFVEEKSTTFHLRAAVDGNQCTLPVTLHIRRKAESQR